MTVDAETSVRESVTVPLSAERAFALFTERMHEWWPASHSIGATPRTGVVLESRAGGHWGEVGTDGSSCPWGRVAAWEPPRRLLLVWQISARFTYDPDLETEVEVTFTEEPPGTTRVDLEHRHLDRFGDAAAAIRDVFRSPGGWPGILAGYAARAGS